MSMVPPPDSYRILMTTAWYPNRKVRGDGVFVEQHALALSRLHRVAVLMVQSDPGLTGRHIEIEERLHPDSRGLYEVRVYVPKVRREVPLLTGLLRLFWLWRGYRRGYRSAWQWFGQCPPDVCHVNVLTRAALLPWWLRWRHKIPYIITEHWSRYGRSDAFPAGRLHLAATRRMVRDAAFVCPVSHNLEQNMLRWRLDNPHYVRVGNVVDTETFAAAPFVERRAGEPIRIVHVSWMRDESKNISGMLRVALRLKAVRRDFRLELVGEGNDKPRLEQLARQMAVDDVVSFLPACRGEALAGRLRQCDFMLMFSHYENQPVSLLEAMACGRPVVATAVGDIPLMAEGRGLCVPPRDEDALLEALLRMMEQYRSYDPYALHDYVERHHSPAAVGGRFHQLYKQCLEHGC